MLSTVPTSNVSLEMPKVSDLEIEKAERVRTFCLVSFDMMFTYVNAGWEGSAHDMPVLKDSLSQ